MKRLNSTSYNGEMNFYWPKRRTTHIAFGWNLLIELLEPGLRGWGIVAYVASAHWQYLRGFLWCSTRPLNVSYIGCPGLKRVETRNSALSLLCRTLCSMNTAAPSPRQWMGMVECQRRCLTTEFSARVHRCSYVLMREQERGCVEIYARMYSSLYRRGGRGSIDFWGQKAKH